MYFQCRTFIIIDTSIDTLYMYSKGCIEPPEAARGHAMFVDGKMLCVTKYRIQHKHVIHRRAPLIFMRSLTALLDGGIPSASFVFDEDLATKLHSSTS